jgi:hypothetical protein
MDTIKLCECGCGQPTRPWSRTQRTLGRIKGEPARFLVGHGNRRRNVIDGQLSCAMCGEWKALDDFHFNATMAHNRLSYCKPCQAKRVRANTLLRKYDITPEQYEAILTAQDGGCALCGARPETQHSALLTVDHCHDSNRVRGLLCFNCNVSLGKMHDDPALLRRAAFYIENSSKVP